MRAVHEDSKNETDGEKKEANKGKMEIAKGKQEEPETNNHKRNT